MTPLYVAVVGGHLKRVEYLVDKGAGTNITDWKGVTYETIRLIVDGFKFTSTSH